MIEIHDIRRFHFENLPIAKKPVTQYNGEFLSDNGLQLSYALIFMDEDGCGNLGIVIDKTRTAEIVDPGINGLNLEVRNFQFKDEYTKAYICLTCLKSDYLDLFCDLCKEIMIKISQENYDVIDSVNETIWNWKFFWSTTSHALLSEEQILGLQCELEVFRSICDINPSIALRSWKGPLKEIHDFEFDNWSLEVKATTRPTHCHIINGLDQLDSFNDKRLCLISFRAIKAENENKSIHKSIVEIVEKYFSKKWNMVDIFYNLLSQAGYSKAFNSEYSQLGFSIIEGRVLEVGMNFPRIIRGRFNPPLESSISGVNYKLDLEGISSFTDYGDMKIESYFF